MENDTKTILTEAYKATHGASKLNPTNPDDFRKILKNDRTFNVYKKGLSEGLEGNVLDDFNIIAESSRLHLVENSYFNSNPYETLTLPILRNFYPKLIAKELVNVMPIDRPDVIKGFMKASFGRHEDLTESSNPPEYPYKFPYVAPDQRISDSENYPTNDISRGKSIGVNVEAHTNGLNEVDIFSLYGYTDTELSRSNAHVERDFRITRAYDSTEGSVALSIGPDVDGNFYSEVTLPNGVTDKITGHVDYLNGVFYWQSVEGNVANLAFECYISLEENKLNSYVNFRVEKIRLAAIQRQISAYWTLPMEQDLKALYDLNLQTELVNIIGEQIAIEIDREIIDDLIRGVLASDTDGLRTASFNKNPPPDYSWGPKTWFENIIPVATNLSAEVYNANLMDSANTIACNPVDAAIFESLNSWAYDGGSVSGGQVGYRTGTVQGGKWKVLISSIVPKNYILMKYRSNDMQRASYLYAPYVPAVLSPFPVGANPSLTVMTRYAKKLIRPESLALLQIQNSAWPSGYEGTGVVAL
jgi:hypothetical protein